MTATLPLDETAAPQVPATVRRTTTRRAERPVVPRGVVVLLQGSVVALPFLRPTGPGNSGPADVGFLLATVAALAWAVGARVRLRFPYAVPVSVMVLGGALATVVSGGDRDAALALGQDLFLLFSTAAMVTVCVLDRAVLRSVLRAWALSGAVWGAATLVAVLGHLNSVAGITARDGTRAAFQAGDANLAGSYFLVTLLVIRMAQVPRRPVPRALACAVVISALVCTGSNGAFLGLVLATGIAAVLHTRDRRGPVPALALACVLLLAGGTVGANVDLTAVAARAQASGGILKDSIGRYAESDSSRTTLYSESFRLWYRSNLTGIGPTRTKATLAAGQQPYIKEAHDDYAAALVERGVLGALGLTLLLVSVAGRAAVLRRRPGRYEPPGPLARPDIAVAALVAVALSGLFYEVLHFRHVWALLALVAAAAVIREQDAAAARDRGPAEWEGSAP